MLILAEIVGDKGVLVTSDVRSGAAMVTSAQVMWARGAGATVAKVSSS
jgi:membrane-bound inhibitor of C-type lysozyme